MDVSCGHGRQTIEVENIDASKGLAYCAACENLNVLSFLLDVSPNSDFDPSLAVKGIRLEDSGYSWSIDVS